MTQLAPPHDCRLTIRCLKESFGFRVELAALSFRALRSQNTVIDQFFERREHDERGGEGGERIAQVKSRPVFALHSGRMRGATWFDRSRPPRSVVWLLAVEKHDERHKGRFDAYDRFAELDKAGELFPKEVDYMLLELDRRRADTESFADDVRADARELVGGAADAGRAAGKLAGVPTRMHWKRDAEGAVTLHVAVSTQPVIGARSGLEFPLTDERFHLFAEAVRQAAEELHKPEVLAEPVWDFPGGLRQERAFVLVFEP